VVRRVLLILIALALASYVAWDRVEAHRLSKAIAAIAARGEPIRADDLLPVPATGEQRQAATLYTQAADRAYERAAQDNNRASRLDVDKAGGTEIPLDEIRPNYRDDEAAL
jgi:hypothetical protein